MKCVLEEMDISEDLFGVQSVSEDKIGIERKMGRERSEGEVHWEKKRERGHLVSWVYSV